MKLRRTACKKSQDLLGDRLRYLLRSSGCSDMYAQMAEPKCSAVNAVRLSSISGLQAADHCALQLDVEAL